MADSKKPSERTPLAAADALGTDIVEVSRPGSTTFKMLLSELVTKLLAVFGLVLQSDGNIILYNAARDGFSHLKFGGTDATHPALRRNTTALECVSADSAVWAPFGAGAITANVTGGFTIGSVAGLQRIEYDAAAVAFSHIGVSNSLIPIRIGGGTPASASAAGALGTVTWDSSYIYICIATNTWKRVAIASW